MIEHAWALLCTKCVIDPDTNNATLTEVLETLTIAGEVQFPTVAPLQMDLVSVWYRSTPEVGSRGSGRVSLLKPDGELAIPPMEFAIDLTNFFRARNIARIAGLPIAGIGIYFFKLELRTDAGLWRQVAKIPLNVLLAPDAAVGQPG